MVGKLSGRELLSDLYYSLDNPSSYSSINNLVKASGLSKSVVQSFLDSQPVYGLHKHPRYKFPRRRIRATGIDQCYSIDLLDCQKLSKFNDGYRFIMICVDSGSRQIYAVPVKTKGAGDMLKAMEDFLSDKNPTSIVTDRGMEFLNSKVSQFLKDRHINRFSTHSELKAVLAERAIRTVKTRIWKFFSANGTSRWVDVLQKIVGNINHTVNRGIGKAPVDMTERDVAKMFREGAPKKKPKFSVGDCVRLAVARKTFKKGYDRTFTDEVFIVSAVKDGGSLFTTISSLSTGKRR